MAVYGRSAVQPRLFNKVSRFFVSRDSAPTVTLTRVQPVDHEGPSLARGAVTSLGRSLMAGQDYGSAFPVVDDHCRGHVRCQHRGVNW